jgi:hypothetical protein
MNNNTQTYEKVVNASNSSKEKLKRITAVILYSVFFAVWMIFALNNHDILVPVLVAGVLCTVMLVLISWKYLIVEYEYSIWYGSFELAKIYSKKKRKNIVSAELCDLLLVAPATEEYISRAEHMDIDKRHLALSSANSENMWLLVTGGKDMPRNLVFFEADERMLAILRQANPSVFVKKI